MVAVAGRHFVEAPPVKLSAWLPHDRSWWPHPGYALALPEGVSS